MIVIAPSGACIIPAGGGGIRPDLRHGGGGGGGGATIGTIGGGGGATGGGTTVALPHDEADDVEQDETPLLEPGTVENKRTIRNIK